MKIGINTPAELIDVGAVEAFLRLKNCSDLNPGLNFLYALVGAVEDRHWIDIAHNERMRLLMELDAYTELEKLLGP